MKTRILNYDWKEGVGSFADDMKPLLAKKGIYLLEDPSCIGSDTYGYILTDKKKFTVGDYRKLYEKEYDDESLEWFDEVCKDNKIKLSDPLTKLNNLL